MKQRKRRNIFRRKNTTTAASVNTPPPATGENGVNTPQGGTPPQNGNDISQPLPPPHDPNKPLFNFDQAGLPVRVPLASTDRFALVADRLKRDLLALIQLPQDGDGFALNISDMLHLKRESYPTQQAYLVHLLCDDVTLFIRERLISAINLLFYDVAMQDDQYIVRLQITYPCTHEDIETESESNMSPQSGRNKQSQTTAPSQADSPSNRAREFLDPEHFRFAILAQWTPTLAMKQEMRRHRYFFDWVASPTFLTLKSVDEQQAEIMPSPEHAPDNLFPPEGAIYGDNAPPSSPLPYWQDPYPDTLLAPPQPWGTPNDDELSPHW